MRGQLRISRNTTPKMCTVTRRKREGLDHLPNNREVLRANFRTCVEMKVREMPIGKIGQPA